MTYPGGTSQAKYRDERGDGDDRELRAEITRALDSSPSLRNKRDLVEAFVDRVSGTGDVTDEWRAYIAERREAELARIIETENLRPDETRRFLDAAFRDGAVQTTGTAITAVLPPTSRFSPEGGHGEKKRRVVRMISEFFERFQDISSYRYYG